MKSIVVADFISILVLLIIVIGVFSKKTKTKSTTALGIIAIVNIVACIVDGLSYYSVGPYTPEFLIYGANLIAYLIGCGLLIVSLYYWYIYINEKTKLHKLYFYIPLGVLICMIIFNFVMFVTGNIIVIENGTPKETGGMPLATTILQGLVVLYFIIVLIIKHKHLSINSIILFGVFYLSPFCAVLVSLFTNLDDFSFPVATLALLIMYVLLDNVAILHNEETQRRILAEKNDELNRINYEQGLQLEKIFNLNNALKENQSKLEKISSEQNAQLTQIVALNNEITSKSEAASQYLSVIEATTQRFFCIYYVDIKNNYMKELKALPSMSKSLGEEGKADRMIYSICSMFVHIEDRDSMLDFSDMTKWSERFKTTNVFSCEYKGITSAASRCTAFAAKRDEAGNVTHVVLTAEMIHEEIAKREELRLARDKANAASDAKTAFLFSMSHDIRTPMNAVMGFRDLIEKNLDDPEKIKDYLNKMKQSNDILLTIINNVLVMARIEKGTISLNEKTSSITYMTDTMHSMYNSMMLEKGINFTKSTNVEHNYVLADTAKVREICINIVTNAYKYTNPGGTISMDVSELPCDKEGYATIVTKITDTGIGMSADFIPHIFDEFAREKNTTDGKIEGTGLGMSIVKKLVDFLGGKIEVESKRGKGTSVSVILTHKIAAKLEDDEPVYQDYSLEQFKGRRILLAEDNDLNAEIAIEILKDVGFIVERVTNGKLAIYALDDKPDNYYDVILMDIQMPVLNGYAATKEIRSLSNKSKANTPIIAMTANAFVEDRRAALEVGMNDHIAKPINIKEMLKKIAKYL